MLFLIIKILLYILVILLILLVIVLFYPISYQFSFNTDNDKIRLKIKPFYFNIFLTLINRIKSVNKKILIINKYVNIDNVTLNQDKSYASYNKEFDGNKTDVNLIINKYKKNDDFSSVTPKSLIKDSIKSDKKISIDNSNNNIVEKLRKILNNIHNLYNKTTDNDIKELIDFIFKNIKKIIINKNTKIYTDLIIGISEPYTMGLLLSFLSILYVNNGDNIKIEPHFDRDIFNGYINIVGKIYLIQIILFLLKVYFHKGFKKLIKK